jgi:hypothetical protein
MKVIGQRFLHNGKIGTCIAATDSGNIKLQVGDKEVQTFYNRLHNIDGMTKGFKVFDLPKAA